MKRIFLLALLAMLCISVYAGTPPPKHKGTGGSAIVNKSADSIGFVFSGDTLWFVQNGLGWHVDSMLTRATLDSIATGLGRFAQIWGQLTSLNDTSAFYYRNDTIVKVRGSNDSTFITPGDNSVLVLGNANAPTKADSLTSVRIYTDTIIIGTDTLIQDQIPAYVVRIEVRNSGTGATLPAGTPVYLTGSATADIPHVDSAKASSASTMPCIGILEFDIDNNANGYAVINGGLANLNTSGFSVGDALYVGKDGGFTTTKPTGSDLIQKVGVVTRSNISVGAIKVVGAGRTNDLPNFSQGANYVWAGSATDSSAIEIDLDSAIAIQIEDSLNNYVDSARMMDTIQANDNTVRSEIRDTVLAVIDTLTMQFPIGSPDLFSDTILFWEADSIECPNGIVILDVSYMIPASSTDTIMLMSFTAATPPVFHDWIDTLIITSGTKVSSATFEDVNAQTIDVGQHIAFITSGQDIEWSKVKIRYYRKTS